MIPSQITISSPDTGESDVVVPSDIALGALIVVTSLNLSAILNDRLGISVLGKASVALVVCALLIDVLRRRADIRLDRLSIAVLLGYLVAAGIGIFWAYDPDGAIDHLDNLYRDAIVAFLVVAVVTDVTSLRLAVRSFYLALAGVALISTIQIATGSYEVDFGGLAGAGIQHVAGNFDSWRLQGPFTDANSYARVLLIGIPLAVQEFFSPSSRAWKAAALCSLTVLLVALFGTYSRGALLGLVAASIPFAIAFRRYWLVHVIATVLVVVLVSQTQYGDRVRSGFSVLGMAGSDAQTDFATLGRLHEMRLAGEMFKENLWVGLGPGGYSERFQRYSSEYHAIPRHEDRQAHSLPLELAADGGLIMLLAFSALCVVLARNAVDAFRACRRHCPQNAALIAGIGLSMVGYLASSMVLHADFSRLFWLLCGLILALPVCVSRLERNATDDEETRIPLSSAPSMS